MTCAVNSRATQLLPLLRPGAFGLAEVRDQRQRDRQPRSHDRTSRRRPTPGAGPIVAERAPLLKAPIRVAALCPRFPRPGAPFTRAPSTTRVPRPAATCRYPAPTPRASSKCVLQHEDPRTTSEVDGPSHPSTYKGRSTRCSWARAPTNVDLGASPRAGACRARSSVLLHRGCREPARASPLPYSAPRTCLYFRHFYSGADGTRTRGLRRDRPAL
jgi:hypothetical protein